jgi:hypothetical protein
MVAAKTGVDGWGATEFGQCQDHHIVLQTAFLEVIN